MIEKQNLNKACINDGTCQTLRRYRGPDYTGSAKVVRLCDAHGRQPPSKTALLLRTGQTHKKTRRSDQAL